MIPTQLKSKLTMDRGQVGIGTLIIFIAMVLVAAVAAGVLINTSGMLESQASTTADDTQDQVTNNVEFVSATGEVDSGGDVINAVSFTVMKGAGADSISIDDATLEFASNDDVETYNLEDAAGDGDTFDPANQSVNMSMLKGSDTSVLQNQDERLEITVRFDAGANPVAKMDQGDHATVTFVDQSGAESLYGVNVPDTLTDDLTYVQV
jgi:flagellin-like protein